MPAKLTRESLLESSFKDAPVFPVVQTNIKLNLQSRAEGHENHSKTSEDSRRKRYNGFLWEQLVSGIFGVQKRRMMLTDYISNSERLEFDVVVPSLNLGIEVKGIGDKSSVELRDGQYNKYLRLQLKEEQLHGMASALRADELGSPRIEVYVIKYSSRDNLHELFVSSDQSGYIGALSTSIQYLLILPFSLFHHIHSSGVQGNGLTSRYNPPGTKAREHDAQTILRIPVLNRLVSSTLETIAGLGVNSDDYQTSRFIFPSNVFLEGNQVTPFPVLKITDKDYSHWIQQLQQIKLQHDKAN